MDSLELHNQLAELESLSDPHGGAGDALFQSCDANLFPCDCLAFAVLERSLNLLKGFSLLVSNGGYTCGAALFRMQLDNVLRFHGVAMADDPHGVASQVITGTPLREIRDREGRLMTDKRLVHLLSAKNPWVERVYNLASSYIHLSDQHFYHFVERCKRTDEAGVREIGVGDNDEYLDDAYKLKLIGAFQVVTKGVLELVNQWAAIRVRYGDKASLAKRFTSIV